MQLRQGPLGDGGADRARRPGRLASRRRLPGHHPQVRVAKRRRRRREWRPSVGGGGGRAVEAINPAVRRMRREASEDPEGFWARAAGELPWFRGWDTVLDWRPPNLGWVVGGHPTLSHNCLDRHVARGWGVHAALIYETERGEQRTLTYAQLLEQVKRTAAALRGLGVRRGDRVAVYMPTTPEA